MFSSYHVHPKAYSSHVRSMVARSILAANLPMDGCLVGFDGVCRGLNFGGFAKITLSMGAGCMGFFASVDVDQVVFVSVLVDGAENLE